jgi:hypothetical protein
MKTNNFLSSVAVFATLLTLFACSNDSMNELIESGSSSGSIDELKSSSSIDLDSSSSVDLDSSSSVDLGSSSSVDLGSSSSVASSSSSSVPAYDTFLGMGYNIITSNYINRDDMPSAGYPVLDRGRLYIDGYINETSATQEVFNAFAGETVKEVIKARAEKLSVGVNANVNLLAVAFSGQTSVNFQTSKNEESKSSIFFSKLNYSRRTSDHKITLPQKDLYKYLTQNFINDLKTKSAKDIIRDYGTHIFVQYYKGASLEANYTYTGSELRTVTDVKNAVGASLSASYAGQSGKVETNFENSATSNDLSKNNNLTFNYKTYGGPAVGATTLEQLQNSFGAWAIGINSSNSDICDIANFNSFIPIWELAKNTPDIASSVAAALETEFNNLVTAQGVALPKAKIYKTSIYYSNNSSVCDTDVCTFNPVNSATIAEVEIYAVGAGGGGQGGNSVNGLFSHKASGRGGAGGGGAAAYLMLTALELNKNQPLVLNISIGAGGTGGDRYHDTDLTGIPSGKNGGAGGQTSVTWKGPDGENKVLKAGGGLGGNRGDGKETNGGAGGKAVCPPEDKHIVLCHFDDGKKGDNGNRQSNPSTKGGNPGEITGIGSISSFGGEEYARNDFGIGGIGGYSEGDGSNGAPGLAAFVIKYFTEE